MRSKILAITFILFIFGLLVLNRFDLSPKVIAKVSRDTGTSYSIGHEFKRGETIHTEKGEFIEISIGGLVVVGLDENTNLQIKSLSKNNVRVGFGHGRILVNVFENDGGNLEVDTPTAQNAVIGRASFVGYDFKHETMIIPLFLSNIQSFRTSFPLLNKTINVTSPLIIHDTNPPTTEPVTFDLNTNDRKVFYDWAWPTKNPI